MFRILERGLPRLLGRNRGVAALEYACSLSTALSRVYCASREPLTRVEYDYLLAVNGGGLTDYRKVVMVGGGALPATAIYWAMRFDGPIVVLEKSRLTSRLGRRLLRKLGLNHVEWRRLKGEAYEDYADSIALLSLHLTNKQGVVDRVLESGGRLAVSVRVARSEGFDLSAARWEVVKAYPGFKVLAAMAGAHPHRQTPF